MFEEILSRAPAGITSTTIEELDALRLRGANAAPGTLEFGDCPICHNKGYVLSKENGSLIARDCSCMVKRRNARRVKESGLEDILNRYTFQSYESAEEWQKDALRKALRFASAPDKWFIIVGTPGTGKTHLCTAICGDLMARGKDVVYMIWREEAPRLKALVNKRDEYERRMNVLKDCDCLYIDDFWKGGNVTEADVNLAFEIINARYIGANKQTIISGEKTIEEIFSIDEAIGSRIYERSPGFRVKTMGRNRRML